MICVNSGAEQRPHTRKTRSPGNGAWFWKAEALRMGSDFQDERRLLRTPKKGQMRPARPRHITKAERLGDGGLVRVSRVQKDAPAPPTPHPTQSSFLKDLEIKCAVEGIFYTSLTF